MTEVCVADGTRQPQAVDDRMVTLTFKPNPNHNHKVNPNHILLLNQVQVAPRICWVEARCVVQAAQGGPTQHQRRLQVLLRVHAKTLKGCLAFGLPLALSHEDKTILFFPGSRFF